MIIADTSLISHLMIPSSTTPLAEKVWRKDPIWVAPLLWRSEFRNVLLKHIRAGTISLQDGIKIMDRVLQAMQEREYQVSSEQVLRLAASSKCTAYDCEFVALAEELKVHLVTTDRQILSQFPQIAVSFENFINN